jgi:hypothetical protein
MPHLLTIDISEDVFLNLEKMASREGKTPEALAQELIARAMSPESDPLLKWIGAFDSRVPDAAERHDHFIGDSLAEELHGQGEF